MEKKIIVIAIIAVVVVLSIGSVIYILLAPKGKGSQSGDSKVESTESSTEGKDNPTDKPSGEDVISEPLTGIIDNSGDFGGNQPEVGGVQSGGGGTQTSEGTSGTTSEPSLNISPNLQTEVNGSDNQAPEKTKNDGKMSLTIVVVDKTGKPSTSFYETDVTVLSEVIKQCADIDKSYIKTWQVHLNDTDVTSKIRETTIKNGDKITVIYQ